MFLDIPDSDFERLLKLAYMGEIMLNDWAKDGDWSDDQRASADLLLDLCARAADTQYSYLVEQDEKSGEWVPSKELRAEMEPVIKTYDDEVFWDELVHRLARRDMSREYGEDADRISDAHFAKAEDAFLDFYNDEVDVHGIERLVVEE